MTAKRTTEGLRLEIDPKDISDWDLDSITRGLTRVLGPGKRITGIWQPEPVLPAVGEVVYVVLPDGQRYETVILTRDGDSATCRLVVWPEEK